MTVDEAIRTICTYTCGEGQALICKEYGGDFPMTICEVVAWLKELMVTAEPVKQKTGKWYRKRIDEVYGDPPHGYFTRYEWRCSVCENSPYDSIRIPNLNYCPNCGTKMKDEEV